MEMVHFAVFDSDGKVIRSGRCLTGDLVGQAHRPGEVAMEIPPDAVKVCEGDLTPVVDGALARIDAEAERFATAPGKAAAHAAKAFEASKWKPGSDRAKFPFMSAECDATGMDMGKVAATILSKSEEATAKAAAVEAARLGARMAVRNAKSMAEIHAAMKVDWGALK